jgi:membrane fusion protein (multidrug efflux system)
VSRLPWRSLQAAIACTFVMACAAADKPEAAGSVLVETRAPVRGSLPDTVVAYGSAAASTSGATTLSLPAEGRITHIAVTTGEAVRAGQVLLELALAPSASAKHSQAVTALALAREQQATAQRLLSRQLATKDQAAQADKALSDAQADLAAIEAEDGGMVAQTVKAPFNGVVSAIPVAQGERVAAGAPLLTVTHEQGLVVTVGVEPALRRKLRAGAAAQMALLAAGEPSLQGSVIRVDRMLNPKTRLVDVDVRPAAAAAADLLEGAAYRATIVTGNLEGWIVPRDALLSDEQGAYVFQVAAGKAVRVPVRRLGGNDEQSVIAGAIDAKRPLVTAGNYQLSDGAAVRTSDQKSEPPAK